MNPCYTELREGIPYPLGATRIEGGWNFSVFSTEPITSLCLAPQNDPAAIVEIPLDAKKNTTGSIWHIAIISDKTTLYYGYRIQNHLLIDPYARLVDTSNSFGNNNWDQIQKRLLAIATEEKSFDWENDTPLHKPRSELIVYEMHIRGYTQDPSSKVSSPGTFLGAIEKIPYLKELGVTAVEILPIHEFNESEYVRISPTTHEKLYNYWGYSPLNFFSPMQRYSSEKRPLACMQELKEMVKAFHKAGIEVLLDIVFNHTGEGNEEGKSLSWKGFGDEEYYLKDSQTKYFNFSGCGNTLNCNNPIVQDLVIETLRYWATEYHIDGFRFDLASILSRGRDGRPLAEPPLLERITHDPILKNAKLIAEPWDAAGLHQVGSFFDTTWQGAAHWMEWNDDFRSTVRRFIKGDKGLAGKFATKLSGSEDTYGGAGRPVNSLNFITCHDGFTLHDLVSYNEKHNLANDEDNRDGANWNESWNCGVEGETTKSDIVMLRERQMKNFMLALLVSQGIPMLHMGDEYGHTKQGNNNTWCQDNRLNWFLWDELSAQSSLHRFCKELIHFRKNHPLLHKNYFLKSDDIDWHGVQPFHPDWSPSSQLVAYTLKDKEKEEHLFIAFHAGAVNTEITLPDAPKGKSWCFVVQTHATHPKDFIDPEISQVVETKTIKLAPYSALMLIAKKS